PLAPGPQIVKVRVGTVPRPALHRHIAAVTELIDVVLHPPMGPRLAYQIRPQLTGDNLIGTAAAFDQRRPIEVHEHPLAHRVKRPIRPTHTDIRGVHQIAEGIGLVGDLPGMADGRGVARRAEQDLCTLVSGLTRHLWEHPVVTNNEGDLRALGAFAYRDT